MTIKIGVVDHLTAAVEGAKKLNNTRDLRKLYDEIGGMLRAEEQKRSAASRRAVLMEAAATDPAMRATLTYAVGRLKSIGLSLEAAADTAALDAALKDNSTNDRDRIALKSALARIGVID